MDVTTMDNTKNNTRRRREVLRDYDFEESDYVELENLNNPSREDYSREDYSSSETGEFFINKTTDQVDIDIHQARKTPSLNLFFLSCRNG